MSLDGGSTIPGKTNWKAYGNNGIYLDVDTSGAGFQYTPLYFTSLAGKSNHWSIVGTNSIYNASTTGFRVYLRWVDGGPLSPEYANERQWHLHWHAIGNHYYHEA